MSSDEKKNEIPVDPAVFALTLCNGNPGAITILGNTMAHHGDMFVEVCKKLAKNKIIGPAIWVLFKNNNQKIDQFVEAVLELD
jgi:hypothetical protein